MTPLTLTLFVALAAALAFAAAIAGRLAVRLRRADAASARRFECSPELICIAGLDGRVKAVNPAFEEALGYRAKDLLGRPLNDFIHPADRDRSEAEAAAIQRDEGVAGFRNRWFDKQGDVHWLEWSTLYFPEQHHLYGVARDVTERRDLEREVDRLAQRDPLTGLFNRGRFDRELTARLDDARRHQLGGALLLIDLDHFKSINGELGHAAGDLALCEVARVLQENTRGDDAVARGLEGMVARVGGDEFAVLLAGAGPVEAAAVGERLVAALESTDLMIEGSPVPLAISVGVAPFDGRNGDAEDLLARADQAMYVVKAGGGGGAVEARPADRRTDA